MEGTVVLTIDLDFFFQPPLRSPFGSPLNSVQDRQQANSRQTLWMNKELIADFVSYLQRVRSHSCFHCIEKHNQALYHICSVVRVGRLQTPFTLFNFDAHSDLYLIHPDSDYKSVTDMQCEQLPCIADESDWIWMLHAMRLLHKYVWIKPSPEFPRFALPELPKSFVKPKNHEVLDWLEHDRPGLTWSDAMYNGKEPQLLEKSFQGLEAERFGSSFCIQVCRLELSKLPQPASVACVTLCRSPGYTALKADDLYDAIVRDSTP